MRKIKVIWRNWDFDRLNRVDLAILRISVSIVVSKGYSPNNNY